MQRPWGGNILSMSEKSKEAERRRRCQMTFSLRGHLKGLCFPFRVAWEPTLNKRIGPDSYCKDDTARCWESTGDKAEASDWLRGYCNNPGER